MADIRQTAVDPITGRRYDDLPQMTETPRSPRMGMLADALMAVRDFANRMQIPQGVPLLGGEGVGSLLLGKAPEELVEMSYGNMPLRINPYAGRTASFVPEMKPGRGAQVADLLSLAGVPGGGRTAAAAIGGAAADLGGVERAMLAYHGTPHRFERFDASKIGTGEGAQAYGHGLYFAESPKVAKGYQTSTSKDRFSTKEGMFEPSQLEHLNVRATVRKDGLDSAIDLARKYAQPDEDYPEAAAKAARDLEKLEAIKASGGMSPVEGSLYTVDIPDEMVGKMLDWDKPLSEQPKAVREAIEGIVDSEELYKGRFASRLLDRRTTGGEVLEIFQNALGGPDVASNYLRDAGIPGIRYLDAGSRGQGGKATSNFVIFPGEENILKILERQ